MSISRVSPVGQPAPTLKKLSESPIDKIPAEMLQLIFCNLEADELRVAGQVSSIWRSAADYPLRNRCLANGLEPPNDGTSWFELQANRERLAKRWREGAVPTSPTLMFCTGDYTPTQFSGHELQESRRGVYVDSPVRGFISLPNVDSTAAPKFSTIDRQQYSWDRIFADEEGEGYLRSSNGWLELFESHTASSATTRVPAEPATCAAWHDDILVTGHETKVRLWKLPHLENLGNIETESAVSELALMRNGTAVFFRDSGRVMYVWDLLDAALVEAGREVDWLGSRVPNRLQVKISAQLFSYSFDSPDSQLINIQVLPHPNDIVRLGSDGAVLCTYPSEDEGESTVKTRVIGAGPDNKVEGLSLVPPSTFWMGDMLVTRDKRWVIVLTSSQEILIWDMLG